MEESALRKSDGASLDSKFGFGLWSVLDEPFLQVGFYNGSKRVASTQLGLWNDSYGLRGFQVGIYNHAGDFWADDSSGVQLGIANSSPSLRGTQLGLWNQSSNTVSGAQIGLINQVDEGQGAQIGFGNYASHYDGVQLGIGNFVTDSFSGEMRGLQISPIFNYADSVKGLQIGAINVLEDNENSNCLQLGLLNVNLEAPWYAKFIPGIAYRRSRD